MLGAVGDTHVVLSELGEKLSEVSEILFFLMGAMTIVEIVDSHEGFNIVSEYINTNSRRPLMWIVGFVTFFMSSVLDNLTSTIVMVSLLRKLVKDPETRKLFGGVIVIAANAGGAWTPIGDVTTTMLWINGNISALATMKDLFLPSLISLIVSLGVLSPSVYGEVEPKDVSTSTVIAEPNAITRRNIVFWGGVGALIGVPIFKVITGPPTKSQLHQLLRTPPSLQDCTLPLRLLSCDHWFPLGHSARMQTRENDDFADISVCFMILERSTNLVENFFGSQYF